MEEARAPAFVAKVYSLKSRVKSARKDLTAFVADDRCDRVLEALEQAIEEIVVATETVQEQSDDLAGRQDALRAEADRFRRLFDLAPAGYIVTGIDGVVQYANAAASALLGRDSDALIGKPIAALLAMADRFAARGWRNCARLESRERRAEDL